MILRYSIPRTSLPSLLSLLNVTLANWNPSLTQYSSCSSSVSLFCSTTFDHTPQLLDVPNHMPSQANQICINHNTLLTKHFQKTESLRAASLSLSLSTSLFHPYFFIKSFLQFSLTLSSSKPKHFFHLLLLLYNDPYNQSLSQPFNQFSLCQGTNEQTSEDWHSFNFSLFPQRIDMNNSHWFPIAQVQKSRVCQVVVFDEYACNQNEKLSNSPSPIPSTYSLYFHTLLTPSQELTLPYKPVA